MNGSPISSLIDDGRVIVDHHEGHPITLTICIHGVLDDGRVFTAKLTQAPQGWAVDIVCDGSHRGEVNLDVNDMRYALVQGVKRLT